MSKPLYVFATQLEAQVPLEKFKGEFLITGMRPIPAAVSLTHHLSKNSYSEVINIGFAGALKNHQRYGEFYEIHTLGKNHHPKLIAQTTRQFPQASLFTSDFPIHEESIKLDLGREYDLVDMEGWAIAWTCSQLKIPCRFIKVVSDFCSKTTSEEIREKGRDISEMIYNHCFQ